jgi:hypothetical protein
MTGIHEFKTANSAIIPEIALPPPSMESCFVAPQGHFFRLPVGNLQGAKLVNIPDIHCVSRRAFDDLCLMAARLDLFRGYLK